MEVVRLCTQNPGNFPALPGTGAQKFFPFRYSRPKTGPQYPSEVVP